MTDVCKDIRKLVIEAAYHAKHGHIPSAMSTVEILTAISQVEEKDDIFILFLGG